MTGEQFIWLIGAHVAGFWGLFFYVLRLRKRLRCLGYCYIDLGDWGIGRLKDATEYYIYNHGEHLTPFILLESDEQFEHKLSYHRQLFARVGLRPPGNRELQYPLEDV